MIIKYRSLDRKGFWASAITNDGSKVVLCGRTVRLFDCNKEQLSHTLSRLTNAIVAVSHTQERLCVLSTSSKAIISLVEYTKSNDSFNEINRITLKGLNTDGGKPCFSNDDKYVFFCIEAKQVWRFSCIDGQCCCIYQVNHPDQRLSLDIYSDQLLITLNSCSVTNHIGIDILTSDGSCLKSLRYSDERVKNKIIRCKWLNAHDILMIYPLDFHSLYDAHQILAWQSTTHLEYDLSEWAIERSGKALYDICMSPKRNYIAYVWLDMLHGGRYSIGVYDIKTLNKVDECTVDAYMDIVFSNNDRYIFLCSDEYVKIALPEHIDF